MKKLDNLTDRELIMFLLGEVRGIKKALDNHLKHVWQVVVALIGIAGVAITSLLIALLTK